MMHNEYAANRALAETRQGPSAYRRMQKRRDRKEAAGTLAGNLAFIFLFALCFAPMFQ